ncbi:MAG: hypothetical protein KDE14_11920 [Rhodobacteraceae bacterium]|nr:hypothetical protein [Paracoccaceae bacterium]
MIFSALVLGLIAAAIGGASPAIALWTLILVIALTLVLNALLPGSTFLAIVFANLIGVYACLYAFFVENRFSTVAAVDAQIGFALPLVTFTLSVVYNRKAIQKLLHRSTAHLETDLSRSLIWLAPMVVIGISTHFLPLDKLDATELGWALIGYMCAIGFITAFMARDIAVFMLDMGLLFRDFMTNALSLVKPAFAFFTWYSMLTIVYGCIFTIFDRYSTAPNFHISGVPQKLTFADGLYVSIVTLSTVGYGDVVARSPVV